ncbi:unnamed protein product [Periconia digitata]|uniref:Uncharacterized protein n=1 Tax=Periconia digitata TaxID=1303443 RepID=A0A9W4UJV5_9PLEO|nr:unnamed protein product [Periconia digitata]
MTDNPSPALALQQVAYNTITAFFNAHKDRLTEIIVLPPAIEPEDGISMQDGINLGVPKKILALAFLEARARFFQGVKENRVLSDDAFEATHTILLFDPEHLTAANHRKRRLLHAQRLHKTNPSFHHLLHRELVYTTTILTSPLHRQSKSPTLYNHRYWLLTTFLLPSPPSTSLFPSAAAYPSPDDSEEEHLEEASTIHESNPAKDPEFPSNLSILILRELTVVLKSGHRHPKNYYAFNYARKLFDHVLSHHHRILPQKQPQGSHQDVTSPPDPPTTATTTGTGNTVLKDGKEEVCPTIITTVTAALPIVAKWCTHTTHAADISGYSFLLYLLCLRTSLVRNHVSDAPESSIIHTSSDDPTTAVREKAEDVNTSTILYILDTVVKIRLSTLAPYLFLRESVADGAVLGGGGDVAGVLRERVGKEVSGVPLEGAGGVVVEEEGSKSGDGKVSFEDRIKVLGEWLDEDICKDRQTALGARDA